ncbi:MAG TPA: hypothetical protein VEF72_17290 [Mycobacterium sp.]|nr:hypothetical protein [Mycobacterium sp.]
MRIELAVAVAQPLITTVPVAMASFAGPTGSGYLKTAGRSVSKIDAAG